MVTRSDVGMFRFKDADAEIFEMVRTLIVDMRNSPEMKEELLNKETHSLMRKIICCWIACNVSKEQALAFLLSAADIYDQTYDEVMAKLISADISKRR